MMLAIGVVGSLLATDGTFTGSARAAGRIDPCALVTKADAEEVFGAPAKSSAQPDYPGLSGSIYSECSYALAAGLELSPSISIGLFQKEPDTKVPWDPNALWTIQTAGMLDAGQAFGAAEKVAAVGDDAFWQQGTAGLTVLKKGVGYFDLTVRDAKGEPSLATAKKLAVKVLSRLH
jgi:hypothetical protein